jgi:uncharacterized membrane protein YbhN (UPF0104 family)
MPVWVNHLVALGLLALDLLVRAWRIQLAVWASGGSLGFWNAIRLNFYGEVASVLTPNRLGGEPARFLGLNEARVRPVKSIVAIGVEVAAEWPVFAILGVAVLAYYVPDWHVTARHWLHRHRAEQLVAIEVVALVVLVAIYLLQRMARAGTIPHRARRQWRVALIHVRRAPLWALILGMVLTATSLAARGLVLPALAWSLPAPRPRFATMFLGSMTLLHAPLVLPIPAGSGGIEVAFLSGFAGDFGEAQVPLLVWWRFYTTVLLAVIGGFLLIRNVGYRAATELFKIGWARRRRGKKEGAAS